MGSTAFKAAETGDPRLAGSIPVHLRQQDEIEQLMIYGSWAARCEGEAGPSPNDIDLLVIGRPDRDEVHEAALRAQQQSQRAPGADGQTWASGQVPNGDDSAGTDDQHGVGCDRLTSFTIDPVTLRVHDAVTLNRSSVCVPQRESIGVVRRHDQQTADARRPFHMTMWRRLPAPARRRKWLSGRKIRFASRR